jgi:hypothetical protein
VFIFEGRRRDPIEVSALGDGPVTVNGSPTCAAFGFASFEEQSQPTAPPKFGGAPGGNDLTSA